MPTAREILGDENIKQLQALGRDNTYIKQFAQNIYNGTANYQPPEMKITDEQRRQYAQSQEFGGAFKRTMTGIGAGAVEFARGAAMYAEDAANWLDPARARATNGEYGAFVNKTKELLDNYKQHEQSWKEVNGGALNIAGGIGELIGGTLIDPLTYLPIGMANHAKRILSFATTGAISGGVAAYGGDKDVLEGMAFGAVGGVVLGEGIRFLGLAGSKAWNNYKNREIAKAQTQEDFNAINQNENFKNINGENTVLDNQQLDFNVYANDVLKKYPDEIKAQVFKDLETNAQKSIIPDDEFSDLKAFYKVAKDVEEIASTDFKAVDDELVNLKTSVTDGAKDSTLNYYNMLKDIQKEGQNQALSNQQIQTYINAKYQPTKNELEVTHLINDGVMVENRLSGFRVLHSLEQSIANPVLTPDGLNTKLKEAGFNEEVSSILTNAYANKDINIAKSYFNEKIQTKGAERVSSAYEKSIRDSRLSAREVERGGVLRTGQDDSSGGRGVELGHQVDSPTSQNDVGRAVRVAGQDTQPSSTLRGVSKGDERVGELTTTARDGTGDSGASSESVVSAKDELHPRVLKEQQKNEQSQKPSATDSKENIQTKKEPTNNTSKNYDLKDKEPIELSKSERKEINAKVDEILQKELSEITPQDRDTLRLYTGEGGLGSNSKGSLTQHYTPYPLVEAMHKAVEKAKLKIDKALEPAVGSGNFVGMRPKLNWTTVDIDPKAHKINQILYPEAKHYNVSYEKFKDGEFDLIISNVPFLETRGAGGLDVRPDIKALHDYYFVSSVDKLKDGGVAGFVTSRGTMDKASNKIRKELMEKANIVGAYRLPSGAFSKNAHTDVSTDIIFLQKRTGEPTLAQKAQNDAFVNSTKTEDGIYLNEYFVKNPEKILGDMEVGVNKAYGTKAYEVTGEADLSKITLELEAKQLPKSEIKHEEIPLNSKEFETYATKEGLETYPLNKEGLIIDENGVRIKDSEVRFSDVDDGVSIFKDISHTKDGRKIKLLEEIQKAGDKQDLEGGVKLIEQYKSEFKTHPYSDKSLKSTLKKAGLDERAYEYGSYFNKKFEPSEVFGVKTRFEGSGKVEVDDSSPLAKRLLHNENNKGEVSFEGAKHIKESDFYNAINSGYAITGRGKLQNEVLYQSGNIYHKLDELEKLSKEFAGDDLATAKLERQKEALEKILPEPKRLEEINVNGNESWLKDNDINLYNIQRKEIRYKDGRVSYELESPYGKVFDNYLNQRTLVDRNKNDTLKQYQRKLRAAQDEVQSVLQKIKDETLSNPELTKRVESAYNRANRAYVQPDYKKARYLIQDALDEIEHSSIKLRENQIDWVVKSFYEGRGINAHDVGGGKTLAGVLLARVLKKNGAAKKPLIVAPAKVINNWEKEIRRLYPDAKIINLGGLGKEVRTKRLYELGNSEADFVLVTHDGLKNLKLPHEQHIKYLDELFNERLNVDELQGRAKQVADENISKYKELLRRDNDDKSFTMDKLGIDAVIVDEARAYKNIGVSSRLAKNGVGKAFALSVDKNTGKPTLDSASAYDFRFKARFISEANNGKNIFLLDATPTPNKPMELYTMIGHLDKDIFKEYGIHSEMDFAGRYFDNGMAPDRNGEFKSALTGINNAPELRAVMDRYVDRISMEQFASMGYIKIPDKKIITHTLEASSESITAFDVISKKLKDKKELLGAYANGINASADPRLYQQAGITDFINPTPQNNKLHAVVDEVLKVRGKDAKAGQIIFLDNAGHTAKVEGKGKDGEILPATLQKNLHQEMKEKFVASGKYKESEIAILSGQEITNPKTGKEISASGERGARLKEEIVEAYNAGKIKVIIGTTQSAGEGMNIQKFTTDIYHMDIPWTMAQIIQRDGRGVRYGNMYDSVNSHFFFQQGTFDELSYKTVMNKKSWNEALWDSNLKEKIEIQSEGGAMPSPDEIALALEKDPVKKRQMQLQVEYNRYNAELDGNYDALGYLNSRVSSAKRDIELYTKEIGELNAKLKLDAPNEGLKNLQQRILKESDKTKKSALQDEFSAKLAKVKEATKRTIELRQKKIGEKNADIEKFGKEVQTIREDIAGIKKQLEEFEGKHFDERGNIKSEFEEVC